MPGIITHNKIFHESFRLLAKRKKKTFLLRSLETLFNSPENYRAALFGSIGPNIFDYIPSRGKNSVFGHNASFFLHNGGSHNLLESMIKNLYSQDDKNTEWSSIQRAYLYGFISHIIADSIYHPFIYYWSGFPEKFDRKESRYYREQNLLFTYNIDNYYLSTAGVDGFKFDLESMLPITNRKGIKKMNPGIKHYILQNLNETYPEIYKDIVWKENKLNRKDYLSSTGNIDFIPYFIRFAYKIKRSNNSKVIKLVKFIKKKNIFFSDFIIRYPETRRVNTHLLNLHMDRWENPAGKIGVRYESIDNLMTISCEKIVDIWERVEASLWAKNDTDVINEFSVNAFTGERKKGFFDMKKKNPLRFYLKY